MDMALEDKSIDALLSCVADEKSPADKVIQALHGICTNFLSNNVVHPSFGQHIFPRLEQILEKWIDISTPLSTEDSLIFHHIANMILLMSKSIIDQLQNNKNLTNLIRKCLNNISSYGYYLNLWESDEYSTVASFDCLIQAYAEIKCKALIEPVLNCATSSFSQQALLYLYMQPIASADHFLLITCPNYVLKCDKENGKYTQSMFNRMISSYVKVFDRSDEDSSEWIVTYSICLIMPLQLIAFNIHSLDLSKKEAFIWINTKILERGLINTNSESKEADIGWMSLIHSALKILLEIARSEPQLLNGLREHEESSRKIFDTLRKLSNDVQNETVQSQAFELLVLIVPEEQFSQVVDTEEVVTFFIQKMDETMKNENVDDEQHKELINELFRELKSLVQNDIVRLKLVQQNILPLLVKYAKESPGDEYPLEIIYTLMFTENGKEELRKEEYQHFIDHVKQLQQSGKEEVRQAANGIIWKIEGEERFKDMSEQQKNMPLPQRGSRQASGISTSYRRALAPTFMEQNFHIMISYCWANKPLCEQIHLRLQKDGYRVWIDQNEMHGSIIERMAEGIEKSDFILMCMSSGYKKSANCQAEAEYAFNRKKNIVPLIVEPKYKADGWLGFIAGNRIYVNFSEKNDEEFETNYKALIVELQRNGLQPVEQSNDLRTVEIQIDEPKVNLEPSLKATVTAETRHQTSNSEYQVNVEVSTTGYRHIKQINNWKEKHVVEFLVDQNLNSLLSALKDIDGQGLVELFHVYERSPEILYKILSNKDPTISPGIFFRFISILKTFLLVSEQYAYF